MRIASRILRIQPSLTLAVAAKANALKAKGIDVVSFGVGEPDFDTPDSVKRAAIEALERGVGKYTPVPGTAELRKAVAAELNAANGTAFAAENIIVSVGAKHSLFNLFMAFLDDGDEVIIPAPCWVSYPELVSLAGGRPIILPTRPEDGYQIDPERLEHAITARTRAIVLNSPCNPTGAVYGTESLDGVAAAMARHPELYAVSDDIYRRLVYDVRWESLPRRHPEIAERVLVVDGVSKSYAMTGWRIGYCAAPKDLVNAMAVMQGQSTTNPSAIAQAAALSALTGSQDTVETMRIEFDRRRKVMVERLRSIPQVRLSEPRGAFYCFPDLSAYIGERLKDDVQLAEWLLERGQVAVVPGSGFYAPGCVRLSYATSMAEVEKGCERIRQTLADL